MQSMSSPRSVEIRLHAYPQLLVDGCAVPLQLKRAWALVACLTEHEARKMSRAQVANLLWPSVETGVGRTRLRRLVHQINTIAGVELVTGDADAVWLARLARPLAVDVVDTRRAALDLIEEKSAGESGVAETARLMQPVSHTILADFGLDSEAFEDWLAARRQDHERLLVRALQCMAQRQLQIGEAEAALASARRLLEIDRFADAGHALQIEALAALGRGAAVETAYDQCASLMRHEFGVRPSAAVEAAYAEAVVRLQAPMSAPLPLPSTRPPSPGGPRVRYVQGPGGSVACATLGSGAEVLMLVPEAWSHIETALDEPRMRRVLDRLAERFTIVMFDRRGSGLSERIGVPSTPEATMEDLRVVLDGLALPRVWLIGTSTCGASGIELAAAQPERVEGLILFGVNARGAWAPDYPWAMDVQAMEHWIALLQAGWGAPTSLTAFAPSVAHEPDVQAWWTRTLQHSTTPNGIASLVRTLHAVDVRHRLPQLRVPTLVLQRRDDRIVRAGAARYLASTIPGAELKLLDGADHFFWHGDADAALDAMVDFIDRHRGRPAALPPAKAERADAEPARRPTAVAPPKQQIRFAHGHDGVRLAYARAGEGLPVIKAATWLSHLEFDWISPVWTHLLRELSRDHCYVRYDERGCGLSDWEVEDLSFESWVRDLETVVDALGAERFALLGISQGASIAIDYAVRHPERVTHLVLHGGYARGRLVRSHTPQQREEAETMAKLAELGWGKADPSFRQFFTSQFIPGGTHEQHQWFNELERLSTSPANAARFMREFATIDVVKLLPQVRCPTLVLHSRDDVRVPIEESRLIANAIPGARFVPIASGNHLLLEDEPGWARWIDEVREFLGN